MTFNLKTEYVTYEKCYLETAEYGNGNLYIGIYNDEGPIADITVNISDMEIPSGNYAFVDTNNFPEVETAIMEMGIGEFAGYIGRSGYCRYPLYRFDMESVSDYMNCIQEEDEEDD